MPDAETNPDKPKKSTKTAKRLTSGQLREVAKKKAAKAAKEAEQAQPEKAKRPPDTREYTVEQWARGRNDPITRAFVATHTTKRTVKRVPAKWMGLYRDFLKKPRG